MTSRRDWNRQRSVIFGAAACVCLVALGRAVPSWRRWNDEARVHATEIAEQHAQALTILRSRDPINDSLRIRRERLDSLLPRLFVGASPNAAGSNVATYLAGTARDARVELGTLQLLPDSSAKSGLRRIAITATGRSDIHGLMRLLAALETGHKLFRISSMSVTQPDVVGDPGAPESLVLQLSFETLARDERRK